MVAVPRLLSLPPPGPVLGSVGVGVRPWRATSRRHALLRLHLRVASPYLSSLKPGSGLQLKCRPPHAAAGSASLCPRVVQAAAGLGGSVHGGRLGLGRTVLWVPKAEGQAAWSGAHHHCTRRGHEEAAPRPLSCGPLGQPGPARSSRDPEMKPQLLPECTGHSSRTTSSWGTPRGLSSSCKHRVWRGRPRGAGRRLLQTFSSTESQSCCLTSVHTAPQMAAEEAP